MFIATVIASGPTLVPLRASARPLEIIHTNDLHSHLDHANDPTRGSYAAVKAVIDQLKGEAANRGIDTLTLDAGDFCEDSVYWLAGRGEEAWRAMGAMGYDAVEIGNHDWLEGPSRLDELVGITQPTFAFLGSNFDFGWGYTNLVKKMRAALETTRAGARIAVLGLTTDDPQYSWMAKPVFIFDPIKKANKLLPSLRARNDFVIALTHIGLHEDKKLAAGAPGIDLIVGGHSHTTLTMPATVEVPGGGSVPIVQAGMHGNYVGDLLVDVTPGKPLQILRYQLIPVYSAGPRDAALEKIEREARARLDREYGASWLSEVVGRSEVPLLNAYYQDNSTAWSDFVAESIRQAGQAEAAIDVAEFEGFDQPAGPLTREQLFVLYPRVFEFGESGDSPTLGYTVWTAQVTGWVLELAIQEIYSLQLPINLGGITAQVDADGNAKDVRINGEPIQSMRSYRIALPEALARGAFGISKYLKLLIRDARDTGIPIWAANEAHLKAVGGVIR